MSDKNTHKSVIPAKFYYICTQFNEFTHQNYAIYVETLKIFYYLSFGTTSVCESFGCLN